MSDVVDMEDYIQKLVDAAPPFSAERLDRIASILRTCRSKHEVRAANIKLAA